MQDTNENKITVAFKCSPNLKSALCEQADRLGITLSSHLENIVAANKDNGDEIKELLSTIAGLKELIAFYEHPFLHELLDRFKGQTISYSDRDGIRQTLTIEGITDVYTVIIHSFKTDR